MSRTHDKKCMTRALICAVENARDSQTSNDAQPLIDMMRTGVLVVWANEYLASGLVTCTCAELSIERGPQECLWTGELGGAIVQVRMTVMAQVASRG